MKDMNVKDVKSSNEQLAEQLARFECECSAGTGRYFPCGRRATEVIEFRNQNGDREHRLLCKEHVFEELAYWDTRDWNAGAEISDIEDWKLGVRYGGRTVTRVGSRYRDAAV
jgi:hypothetical protein